MVCMRSRRVTLYLLSHLDFDNGVFSDILKEILGNYWKTIFNFLTQGLSSELIVLFKAWMKNIPTNYLFQHHEVTRQVLPSCGAMGGGTAVISGLPPTYINSISKYSFFTRAACNSL